VPPRHAYWTILIDGKPTAFRAREQEELLPTFHQLQRKNTHVEMKWFARGRLWETQQAERDDFQRRKHSAGPSGHGGGKPVAGGPDHPDASRGREPERRSGDWRPGGAHKDPRDRFKKKNRPDRMWSEGGGRRDRDKPPGPPRGDRPWRAKPAGPPRGDRPWREKPAGPPRGDRPSGRGFSKPPGGAPPGDRPWRDKPPGPARGDRPWQDKAAGPPRGERPWRDKPPGPPRGDRPWQDKAAGPPRGERPAGKTFGKPQAGGGHPPRGGQGARNRAPQGSGPKRPEQRPGRPGRPGKEDAMPERREAEPPPSRPADSTVRPPPTEQVRTKPKPPERG
jgi:hypothetical protein